MKLLWLDINSSYAHSSMALPAIEAQRGTFKSPKNITWISVSATTSTSIQECVQAIVASNADIIAATAWLFTHAYLREVLVRVKALYPKIVIICGGPEFAGDNKEYLSKNNFIDALFRGEGEEEFHHWLKLVDNRNRWKEVKGICYISKEGYYDGGTARVADFKALNPPEKSSFFPTDKPFVQIESSRGCFNSCLFCVSGGDKPIRDTSIEQLRQRLNEVAKQQVKDIRILDRTFNGNSRRAIEMLNLFEEFAERFHFHIEIHPALLNDTVKERLCNFPAAVLHIEAGIQSLSQEVITASGRLGGVKESYEGLLFLCSLDNIEVHADLIAGLPLYSLDALKQDVATLIKANPAELQMELLKLLPGTSMRHNAENLGIVYSPYEPYEVLKTDYISASELAEASLLSRFIDGFYNCKPWQKIVAEITQQKGSEMMIKLFEFAKDAGVVHTPVSLERRGRVLFDFCAVSMPELCSKVTLEWVKAGLSLKKAPQGEIKSLLTPNSENIDTIEGTFNPDLRFYSFNNYIIGFDRGISHSSPIFIGIIK